MSPLTCLKIISLAEDLHQNLFFLLVLLGERRELGSVTLKTFYYLGLVTGST